MKTGTRGSAEYARPEFSAQRSLNGLREPLREPL